MNALPLVSVIVQFATDPVTIAMYSLIHHTLSPVVHITHCHLWSTSHTVTCGLCQQNVYSMIASICTV